MRLSSAALLLPLLMLLAAPSVTPAQSRPHGGDESLPGAYQQQGSIYSTYTSYPYYPAVEVQAVPPAMAARAVATGEFNRAYSNLNQAVRLVTREFEASEEATAAQREEAEAFAAYEDARRKALEPLQKDDNYVATVRMAENLKRAVEDARLADRPNRSQIEAAAAMRLEYAARIRNREAEYLEKDAGVRDARNRLQQARNKAVALRNQWDLQVRRNPDLAAARKSLWDARIARLGAAAYLQGVYEAREIALSYLGSSRRYNPYAVAGHSHVYPSVYGYGYHNPHWPR